MSKSRNKKEYILLDTNMYYGFFVDDDFEKTIFKNYPELEKIKKNLEKYGLKALMSGSGSTIFAIGDKKDLKKAFQELKNQYKFVQLAESV